MRSLFALPLIVIFVMGYAKHGHANQQADLCENKWHDLIQRQLTDTSDAEQLTLLRNNWQNLDSECRGTGVYEYRLGVIYERLGEVARATALYQAAKEIPSGYSHLPELSLLIGEAQQLMAKPGVQVKEFMSIEAGFESLVNRYQQWHAPLEHYARVEETLGNYARAIELANKTIALEPKSWTSYKVLTVAYTETGDYERAIAASAEALNINKGLFSDPKFMLSLAMSYAKLRQTAMSDQAISILKKNAEGIEKTGVFKKVTEKIDKVNQAY